MDIPFGTSGDNGGVTVVELSGKVGDTAIGRRIATGAGREGNTDGGLLWSEPVERSGDVAWTYDVSWAMEGGGVNTDEALPGAEVLIDEYPSGVKVGDGVNAEGGLLGASVVG